MESTFGESPLSEVIVDQPNGISSAIISEIISALKSIRNGSIEVAIHNSKIVQIQKKEKFRIGQRNL
jgi:hypothetical protein